jgi:hypothetical protein
MRKNASLSLTPSLHAPRAPVKNRCSGFAAAGIA